MGLRDFVLRLFGPDPAATAGTGPGRGGLTGSRPSAEERARRNWEHFQERLSGLTTGRPGNEQIVTGRLQMIGLEHVRAELGEEWPRIVDKVKVLARRVIERRLTPEDAYLHTDEATFVILFARLGPEEASFKAKAIAHEITSLLLGEVPGIDELPTTFETREVAVADLAAVNDLDDLKAVLEDERQRWTDAEPTPSAAGPGTEPAELLQFEYHPVWCHAWGTVRLYHALAIDEDAQGGAGRLHDQERSDAFDLDCVVIEAILADAEAMLESGNAALVVVPVHWRTLTLSGSRPRYLDVLRQAPPELVSALGFEICAMPAGTWQVSMLQHLPRLQPFGRFLMVDVEPDVTTIGRFQGSGVRSLIIDAAGIDLEDALARWKLQTFVRRAHQLRLGVFARNVQSSGLAARLVEIGVDLMAGPALAAAVPLPGHPFDLILEL